MEKAKEFLEKTVKIEEFDRVSRLNFPPHRTHIDSSFYEYFVLRGIRVDRVQPGSITFSFKVPHRLTNKNGNLVPGAIATLVDELGAAVIHVEGQPMDVSIDMSISYLSTAKMGDELEITSRVLGHKGNYSGTNVLIRNKATGEVVAEGRHSLFSKPASKMASSNDAQSIADSSSFGDQNEVREPSFLEFITSERVKVVAMLALALALCNADRVVMSVAIVPLSLANGWRQSFAGIVQSSFLWGYMISPIAGGTLVDYYGGKVVMAWGVALWSLATFLTPWAAETSVFALLAMRMLLGIAEGVALPCMNNMIARWFPQTERARVVGLAMAGFQLGSAIGLTLSPILMSQGGMYGPFVIFGLSGFLWVLVWVSATSSTPEQSPQISMYELKYIQNKVAVPSLSKNEKKTRQVIPPFRRLLSKLPTWSIIVANAMHSWGFFVILSWMPIYFKTIYHVDLREAAWFSAVPWSMMAVVGYFAGFWSDMMVQTGISVTLTRKIMQSIGFIGPGIALIGLTTAKSPLLASAWLTVAVGLKAFSHCGFLVNLQEISPQYSGVLHGISNTAWLIRCYGGNSRCWFLR
ncbi:putative anion transporter 4 [Abeliophyllum distichum]|uniref:Acyl-coenzyme A thioesterase 13 n=1 Tax=Abeliophyllum distichum TaxID=126358 RepID=A0ABD1RD83_9LAMI